MLNFLLVHKFISYSFDGLLVSTPTRFNSCIIFLRYLMIWLSHFYVLISQYCLNQRLSYSFCMLSIVPFEAVFELWVANGAPYYCIMQPWFDLFFFCSIFGDSLIFIQGIWYGFYVYLISVIYLTTSFDAVLYSGFWLFLLYGGFVLFLYLIVLLCFFVVAFSLYLIDVVFKTPIAGLVLLSREFAAIEDEDLWISSNIFYMDTQIKKAKDFVLPLKIKEIEAFTTLIKLFFDEPLRNLQYNNFSGELSEFRRLQRISFTEKKRLRNLTRGLIPKRKFQRFKKSKRGVTSNLLLTSYQDRFVDKASLNISQSRAETHFYKFLIQNLRFYYLKPPTKKQRLKRIILLRNRVAKQQVLSLRFKDRAAFGKKLSSVYHGPNLSTGELLPPINDVIIHMQPQVLLNDFVKPYLVPKVNLKEFIFGSHYGQILYNQSIKIPRFKRFLWFSLPFYLSITTSRSLLLHAVTNGRRFFVVMGDWLRSKFLGIFFAIFEDSWAIGQFRTRTYSPRQLNLSQFLKLNNLSFTPIWDNPEEVDDGPLPVSQLIETPTFEVSTKISNRFDRFKLKRKQEQPKIKKTNLKEDAKMDETKKGTKEDEKTRQRRKLKKKAYRKRLRRKRGTTRRNFLISRQRYHFSNVSNVAGVKYPELRLLQLYKLLEYFYFVLTNDSDFYEVAMFSAKVASLRDKYGRAIVADLLDRTDHKQASKVSVIMHVTEKSLYGDNVSQTIKGSEFEFPIVDQDRSNINDIGTTTTLLNENNKRYAFKGVNSIAVSPSVAGFCRDLLFSYRYRFRF